MRKRFVLKTKFRFSRDYTKFRTLSQTEDYEYDAE
jgi:hypothetical protein